MPDFWMERRIARFYTARGFACAILKRGFFHFSRGGGLDQIDDYLWGMVKLAKRVVGELAKNPQINPNQILSLGLSFGGIINVILCAIEPKIKAAVIACAGGNIPEILMTSRDPLVKFYYRQVLQGTRLNAEDLAEVLKKVLRSEPLVWAPFIPSDKILFVTATLDRVIHKKYSEMLREALNYPKTIYLPMGHYFSFLALPYMERRALHFFKQKLL